MARDQAEISSGVELVTRAAPYDSLARLYDPGACADFLDGTLTAAA